MKKTGKHIGTLLLAIFTVFFAKAQGTEFYASVNRNPVATGQTLTYSVTLENSRGRINAPDLSDFNVIFGPSTSSNFRIINGRQTSAMTVSYTMRPRKVGTFIIGSASVVVDGKRLSTKPIEVRVTKGTGQSKGKSQGSDSDRSQTSPSQMSNFMVQVHLNKREVYLGEEVIATFVILTRYRNVDVTETNFPALPGFWSEHVEKKHASWEQNYTRINGVPYRKAVIRTQILFPQRTGKLTIPPLEVTAQVGRSFLRRGTELKAKSNSPTITVNPLPGEPPASYDGAVGQMRFSAELDREEVSANDAINLSVTISGQGNLMLIGAPAIKFPADFDTYDPETKDRIRVTANGVSGSRSFQYLIIPRYPGEYEIPAIHFSYFNPATARYVTESAGPFQIHVAEGAGSASNRADARSQNLVEQSNEDIHYIKTDSSKLTLSGKKFFKSPLYFSILSLPFLFFVGFIIFRKKREADAYDVEGTRRRKANKMARKRLKSASVALKNNNSKLFYAEIFKALYGYMTDKLNIPGSLLSRQVIIDNLQRRAVDPELISELSQTIETCEMARFASTEKMGDADFYSQTVRLIAKLDNKIR